MLKIIWKQALCYHFKCSPICASKANRWLQIFTSIGAILPNATYLFTKSSKYDTIRFTGIFLELFRKTVDQFYKTQLPSFYSYE